LIDYRERGYLIFVYDPATQFLVSPVEAAALFGDFVDLHVL
jgi:hypothetical protein